MKTAGMLAGDGSITVNVDQRKLAFDTLARLPEDFVRRIKAGENAAIDAVLDATENGTPFRDQKALNPA